MKHNIEIGSVFGNLVVVSKDYLKSTNGRVYVHVRCSCGVQKSVRYDGLYSGNVVSCGCGKKYHSLKHGHNKIGKRSSEYCSWDSMVQRCTNKKHPCYKHYGARGIILDVSWLKFESFISDMGNKPFPTASIERLNNNLGYCKANCVWATQHAQMRNTRRNRNITIESITQCVSDWASAVGIPRETIYSRLRLNWAPFNAVFTPLQGRNS